MPPLPEVPGVRHDFVDLCTGVRAHDALGVERIELADASHWIVDERPDLVADRARALFG